jgi:spermidine synthase
MPPLTVLVFVVGMGSLGAEIAAVRLLAPYFGASTVIWANTIGVVLVALSIGYWLGGRWADRNPSPRALCRVALLASILLAIVPFVARPMLDIAVKALDHVSAGAFLGSLLAVLVLVAVPVLLLGTVSPWALRLAVDDVEKAGTVAGRLYALGTAGSLVGTLLSSLLLIPLVGTRHTFLLFALAIAVVAALGLRPVRRYALAPAAILLLMLLPVGTLKASDNGRVIHETETEYQYARVIERSDGSRVLELNEGQAYHSVYRPDTVLTGDYWDDHLVLAFATGRRTPPERVAILGNAGGTTARAYGELFPATRVDGVEIDGELSEIGREYFGMTPRPTLHLHAADARPWLREQGDVRFDAISVDAYRQPYIPFYLTTREFFQLVRDRLAPDGVVIVNVGHPEGQDTLEKVLAATMGAAFPYVVRDPVQPTNTQLVASRTPLSAERLRAAVPRLPRSLRPVGTGAADRLAPALRGGDVYTDDRAPVEWLVDKSIVDYANEGAP